ncbi:MAG: PsbP-related protein [Nitrososphaeraceae archaeon]
MKVSEFVLLFFFPLLLSANPVLASSKEDEGEENTTEFESYTNSDYGFSIDYPSDWQEQESNLQEFEVVHFLSPDDIPGAINILQMH